MGRAVHARQEATRVRPVLLKRGHAAVLAAFAVAGGTYFGCSGDDAASSAAGGGGTTEGSSGAGASGMAGGAGKASTAGAAGTGGAATTLVWADTTPVGTCSTRILQDTGFPAFTWAPCPWGDDPACEEAVWQEPIQQLDAKGVWRGVEYQTDLESKVDGGMLAVSFNGPSGRFSSTKSALFTRGSRTPAPRPAPSPQVGRSARGCGSTPSPRT